MMRAKTDQAIYSPLGLVCILMVYVFCNLFDSSPFGGEEAFVCFVRTGTNLSFFFSIHRVQMKTLIISNGSGFSIYDEAAQSSARKFPLLHSVFAAQVKLEGIYLLTCI